MTEGADPTSPETWAARGFALLAEYQEDEHGPYRVAADALDDVLPSDAPAWLRQGALRLLTTVPGADLVREREDGV